MILDSETGVDLPEQLLELRQAFQEMARTRLGGSGRKRDREARFWREGWRACAEEGLLALPVPRDDGGRAEGMLATIIAMEALGEEVDDLGLLFAINAHLWAAVMPIVRFGSVEQKTRWLPGLLDGTTIAGHGATESNAGSDVFSMGTTARREGGAWVVEGTKSYVANAPVADVLVVYAVTEPGRGELGISAFIVPRDTPGLRIGEPLETMGLRSAPSATVVMEACRLPDEALLGSAGGGAACFNASMEMERGAILAMHVGRMSRQLDEVIEFARTRRQFDRPVGSFQSVANRIVDMRIRLETSRPLVRRIGELKDQGRQAMLEAAMAKLHVSESAVQSALDAVQIMGSRGYLREGGVERDLRDALGARIYSGTSEMQRVLVARLLGLPSSLPERSTRGEPPEE